jgi:hypothetical protein
MGSWIRLLSEQQQPQQSVFQFMTMSAFTWKEAFAASKSTLAAATPPGTVFIEGMSLQPYRC